MSKCGKQDSLIQTNSKNSSSAQAQAADSLERTMHES